MKRVIALLLALILFAGVLPIDAAATEQEFVNVQLILDGKPRQYKVIESGSELMFSGEDLAAMGGYEYHVEKGSAYFTRGMKTLRVDLDESRMYPFEDITLVGKVKMAEKVREVDSVYYFPGTEMLPWLNVDCFVLDGQLNICKDEVSIWEIIPVFDPEEFEFDFTACCKELGVNGKYLKARAYLQDEGLTGMFFDIIPVVGDSLDYYDLFEDIVQDQSAADEDIDEMLEDAEDVSYWMEIADDFEVIEDLPDELRLFGEVANFLSNNAVSFSFEMASYVKNFYQNHENILAAFHSMIVNSGVYKHQLPMTAISALMEVEESYTDYYAGIEYKMMKTIGETAFEGLASVPSGLFDAATTLVGFAEATSPDWAEGINRISSYDMIAEYCVRTYGELTDHTWMSSIKDMCGLAYMYLYSCEQNWNAMADYAIKEGKLDLAAEYRAMAESTEEWQRKFMEAVPAAMNDSHEYEVVDGSMKQGYTDKLIEMFADVEKRHEPGTPAVENGDPDDLQEVVSAVNALLSGVQFYYTYTEIPAENWDDETVMDAIYGKLVYMYNDLASDIYLKNGLQYYEDDNYHLHYNLQQIQKATLDAFGRDYPIDYRTDHCYVSGDELVIIPAFGEGTQFVTQHVYQSDDTVIAVGGVFPYGFVYEFAGYFKAVFRKNPASLYGYTLISLCRIEGNQDFNNLDAKASSELVDSQSKYSADNVLDGSLNTAWSEGVQGKGIGEWISIKNNNSDKMEVIAITISSGYQKSQETLENNGRPCSILIEGDDGYRQETRLFDDTDTIVLERPVSVNTIKITILDAYSGQKYEDTCISEVSFVGLEGEENGLSNCEQEVNILADGIYDVSFSPMDFSRTNEGINLTFKYYDYDTVEKAYAMNLRVGDSINQNGEVVIIETIEFDSWLYYDLEMHSVSINDGCIYYQTDTRDPSVMAVFDDTGLFPRYSYIETVTLPLNHVAIFHHETNPYDDAVRIQYNELMDYVANNYGGAYEQATTLTVEDGMIVEIYHTWIP